MQKSMGDTRDVGSWKPLPLHHITTLPSPLHAVYPLFVLLLFFIWDVLQIFRLYRCFWVIFWFQKIGYLSSLLRRFWADFWLPKFSVITSQFYFSLRLGMTGEKWPTSRLRSFASVHASFGVHAEPFEQLASAASTDVLLCSNSAFWAGRRILTP